MVYICLCTNYLRMHRNNRSYRLVRLGTFLLIILGVGFFFGFNDFLFSNFPWYLFAIIVAAFVLVSGGISMISRSRKPKNYQNRYNRRVEETYKPYNYKTQTREETDFTASSKYVYNVDDSSTDNFVFCDYCGVKLEEKIKFCINCGRSLS